MTDTPATSHRAPLTPLDGAILCAAAASVYLLVTHTVLIGSRAGGWVFPYIQDVSPAIVALAAASAVVVVAGFQWTTRGGARSALLPLAVWTALGPLVQLGIRALYPASFADIVQSTGCTSFYTVTTQYAPLDLVRRFDALAPSLPLHASYNMPGKIFLYYFLELFVTSPGGIGVGMVAVAMVGSLLVFAVTRQLFCDNRIATLAMVLSALMPGKVAFLPLPNTVSPLWGLAAFWVWLLYLDTRRTVYLWLLGGSLYLIMFMDPLVFVLGLIFVGVLVGRLVQHRFAWTDLWQVAVVPALGFLAVHLAMRVLFGFDAAVVFPKMLAAAIAFNQQVGRSYGIWVVQNLKEFFFAAGVVPSLAVLAALAGVLRTRALFASPAAALTVSVVLTVLVVDLMGVNRGEVTRLWIFLGVFVQVVCAHWIGTRPGRASAALTLAAVTIQTVIMVTTVGFLRC